MSRRREYWLAVGLTLLGAFLRLYRIAAPALRGDEAFAYFFAIKPLTDMFAAMAVTEPNPPLHSLALRAVVDVAGRSELAIRIASVWAGVLVIPLVYRVMRSLVGKGQGRSHARLTVLLGTLLVAVNPTLVWDSQDARTYALTTALCMAAWWATLVAARRGGRAWLAATVLWLLGLFSHYFAIFALLAVGLWAWLSPGARNQRRSGLAWGGAIAVGYAPWAAYVAPLLAGHQKGWISSISPPEALWRVVEAVGTLWTAPDTLERNVLGALAGAALLIGSSALVRRWPDRGLALLAYAWVTPLVLVVITVWRPVFYERYFAQSVPGLAMVMAAGVGCLSASRRWKVVGFGLMATSLASAAIYLRAYYFNPDFAKSPDWRELVDYLADHTSADDAVLQNFPDPALKYYFRGPAALVISPPAALPADPSPDQLAAVNAQIDSLNQSYARLWYMPMPGPGWDTPGHVSRVLEACCQLVGETFVARMRVQEFETPRTSLGAMQPFRAEFADAIQLAGFRLLNDDNRLHSGERLRVTLYWRTTSGVSRDYTVFTHLVAWDGYQVAAWDNPPVGGRRPTTSWRPGETIVDPYAIPVPAGLAAGQYTVQVGLYDPSTLLRLPVIDSAGQARGDYATLPVVLTYP